MKKNNHIYIEICEIGPPMFDLYRGKEYSSKGYWWVRLFDGLF